MGVKNFDGNVLINAIYDKLEIVENIHAESGALYQSFAVCTQGRITTIFKLS